ncbi:MAG TPA: tRNA epoxyqueuosine(34) reductase QueG [Terriglobales bacterium]|nr:tRNA epoxyqueuosine(34) reductase QueG [Terriglobales bacterium]
MSCEQRIRTLASETGFGLCGFARVSPPPHREMVENWLAEGNAASMDYLERGLAKRFDPSLLLPGVRSVISLGCRYQPPPLPNPPDWRAELRGRIAAYALGVDYHRVVEKKLKQLARALMVEIPGAQFRWYVDTGPVLEREWAAASGLGWFGKNTNILHREQGSWFFLAELLTDLELAPDPPVSDHCGSCTSCLDLCPTGALAPGYRLDARRCISYWTIEHRGPIAPEIRPQLGNWVFGCDICQEVCPWNEKYGREHPPAAAPELFPSLPELLRLDEESFRLRFRATPLLRSKREGLARNAAVALGNSGNPAAIVALAEALQRDPAALVRGHAAWALGQLGATAVLEKALSSEEDPQARAEIEAALA